MSRSNTKASKRVRHKLHNVEQRLEALREATEKQAKHAVKALYKHLASLEVDARKAKDRFDQADADIAAWVVDADKTVRGWTTAFDARMLQPQAKRFESIADAPTVVALAADNQSEQAMLSASLARANAKVENKRPSPCQCAI